MPSLTTSSGRSALTRTGAGCTKRWSVGRPTERDFDPEAVRQIKALARRDLIVGGPELAAQAFKAGLVDELHLFVAPMVVGGGKRSLPNDVRLKLQLLDERHFGSDGLPLL